MLFLQKLLVITLYKNKLKLEILQTLLLHDFCKANYSFSSIVYDPYLTMESPFLNINTWFSSTSCFYGSCYFSKKNSKQQHFSQGQVIMKTASNYATLAIGCFPACQWVISIKKCFHSSNSIAGLI